MIAFHGAQTRRELFSSSFFCTSRHSLIKRSMAVFIPPSLCSFTRAVLFLASESQSYIHTVVYVSIVYFNGLTISSVVCWSPSNWGVAAVECQLPPAIHAPCGIFQMSTTGLMVVSSYQSSLPPTAAAPVCVLYSKLYVEWHN